MYCKNPACGVCRKPGALAPEPPVTQKARGLVFLSTYGHCPLQWTVVRTPEIGSVTARIAWLAATLGTPDRTRFREGVRLFLRPAPPVPVHGACAESESLDVAGMTVQQAAAITLKKLVRVLEEIPGGELIVMRDAEPTMSGVWTPGRVSVGKGHDGITAGKEAAFSMPCPEPTLADGWYEMAVKGVIDDGLVPFIEFVRGELGTAMVQFRSGPRLSGRDFIPTNRVGTVIEEVLELTHETDLKTLPEVLAEASKRSGLVVHCREISSHMAVQARCANIPVITSERPEVGSALKGVGSDPLDPKAAALGAAIGLTCNASVSNPSQVAKLVLASLHSVAVTSGRDSFVIGLGAGLMVRLGNAATLGERRHGSSIPAKLHLQDAEMNEQLMSGDRGMIYHSALKLGAHILRPRVVEAFSAFKSGTWKSGYGGIAWARCTAGLIMLDSDVISLIEDPTPATLSEVIGSLNVAVNQSHNNGWWLNKFVEKDSMDDAANGEPRIWIDGALCAAVVLGHKDNTRTEPAEILAEALSGESVPGLREKARSYLEAYGGLDPVRKNTNAKPDCSDDGSDDDSDDDSDIEDAPCDCVDCKASAAEKAASAVDPEPEQPEQEQDDDEPEQEAVDTTLKKNLPAPKVGGEYDFRVFLGGNKCGAVNVFVKEPNNGDKVYHIQVYPLYSPAPSKVYMSFNYEFSPEAAALFKACSQVKSLSGSGMPYRHLIGLVTKEGHLSIEVGDPSQIFSTEGKFFNASTNIFKAKAKVTK